jgi:hypothetical protein
MSKAKFDSEFLNEQLGEGNIAVRTGMIAAGLGMICQKNNLNVVILVINK